MGNIEQLLLITSEVGVLEHSDFNSAHDADLQAARTFLETKIKSGGGALIGIPIEDVIQAAHPTPSQIRIYELGCGLRILLPVAKSTQEVTSFNELHAVTDFTEIDTHGGIVYPPVTIKPIAGTTAESRINLMRMLNNSSWVPLEVKKSERFKGRQLGDYTVEITEGCSVVAAKEVVEEGVKVRIGYSATVDTQNPGRVQSFDIAYSLTPIPSYGSSIVNVVINVSYDPLEEVYKAEASVNKPLLFEKAKLKFNGRGGLSRVELDLHDYRGNGGGLLPLDMGKLETLLSSERVPVSLGQIAAMSMLPNMGSPTDRLDYANSILNIIAAASQPQYREKLERFEPIVFTSANN